MGVESADIETWLVSTCRLLDRCLARSEEETERLEATMDAVSMALQIFRGEEGVSGADAAG